MDNLDWLNIYNQDLELEIHSIEQPDNFDFRDIPNEFKIDRMTLLTQFFIAQYALGKEKKYYYHHTYTGSQYLSTSS
ncbi:hypothetical protein QS257_02350 [Terrilactibacillus sp. S3-3]|nr:hypothetical protein QS257_02350 [Terrilactibacillus sp. S3-3]